MTHEWMKPFEECGQVNGGAEHNNLWLAFELAHDKNQDKERAKNARIYDAAEATSEALAEIGAIQRHGLSPEPVNFFRAEIKPGQKLYVGVARMEEAFEDVRDALPNIKLPGHGVFRVVMRAPTGSSDDWPPGDAALVFSPQN